MNTIFRQLLIASALSIATLGANAQPASTTPSTSATKPDQAQSAAPPSTQATPPPSTAMKGTQTQAERDFDAAKAACEKERSRSAMDECLRRANDNFRKATGAISTPLSGAGSSGNATRSAGQRS